MATKLPLTIQTSYQELVELASLSQFKSDFPEGGNFFKTRIKDRDYWYYQSPQVDGKRFKKYVGPDSEKMRSYIERHRRHEDDLRQRRTIVRSLLGAGVPGPDNMTGRILNALSQAGVFRMRAVVVGTVAYQCYSGLLGYRLGSAAVRTGDLDIAQFNSISVAVEDQIDVPILDVLKGVDEHFEAIPDLSGGATRYALGPYRVEFLVPNRGPDTGDPIPLPAIQTEGIPLRFLDYLIYEEKQAVALWGPGILINVPSPIRYALHKIIVSVSRASTAESMAKAQKDRMQAEELISVLLKVDPWGLADGLEELLARGPGWKKRFEKGRALLGQHLRDILEPERIRSMNEQGSLIN